MQPTMGRIVIFKITDQQAQEINRRRTDGSAIADRIQKNTNGVTHWPLGAQAHIGNTVQAGEEFPLTIVRVWADEFGTGNAGVNGQLHLDGNDIFWVTSAGEGNDPGQWRWPERV